VTDVIVVGGGPAGATLAIALGRRGFEVELYDQATFPREKPCGEGLLPGGVGVLRALELVESVGGERLSGVRYHVGQGSVRSDFGEGDGVPLPHGVGQRRLHLDATLWSTAARTRGVRANDGTRVDRLLFERDRVRGVVIRGQPRRSRLVVAADGSSSPLRRKLGLECVATPRRVGIRAHFQRPRDAPALTDIEIFLRRGYEIYVTPLPKNEILVAALAHEDMADGDLRGCFARWLAGERLLQRWLEGSTPTSELMGRAPLVSATRGRLPSGLVLIGDAAASVDPITAGGLSLALQSAELCARYAGELMTGKVLARHRFARAHAGMVRVHRWLGAAVLALAGSPRLAETARRGFRAYPNAMRALVELAAGA
jgi:flavin-dependent dehydrogenase